MAEGFFYILTNETQKPHLDKTREFLKEHGASVEEKSLADGVVQLSTESTVEFPIKDIVTVWREALDSDDWYRMYDWNEYGDECFLYVDKDDAWRICTSQEEPNYAKTIEAYRRWHTGLGDLRFGGIEEPELKLLEYKYGLFDSEGQPMAPPSPSLRQQMGTEGQFLGKGIKVPHAAPHWDWYILDHQCLAVGIARGCEQPPEDGQLSYSRSYMIEGNPGYVWTWRHNGNDMYLLFIYFGESSFARYLLRNLGNATIDELILGAYFDEEVGETFEEPDSWIVSEGDEENTYLQEPLQAIDGGPFDPGSGANLFDGRVISGYSDFLVRRKGKYFLAQGKGAKDDRLEILDPELDAILRQHASEIYDALDKGVWCRTKVRMKDETAIAALVGIQFSESNYDFIHPAWLEELQPVSKI